MSMQITDVRVKLCGENSEQLKAFCSITLDDSFVVRDLKVIEGTTGLFVAMPSRKLSDRCNKCRHKNHLRARFCNECGARLRDNRTARGGQGRSKLYVDVAHPINSECRKLVQETVVEAYKQEVERSQQPDYVPQAYDEEEPILDVEESEPVDSGDEMEEVEDAGEISEVRSGRNTNEYDDLIRHLKNDAMSRRQGVEPAFEPEAPAEVDYNFADDDQDLAVEQPRAQASRPSGPSRRDQGPSRPGRENRGPRPSHGQRSGPRSEQRRGDGDRDRDRDRDRGRRPDGGSRSDQRREPQRQDSGRRSERPQQEPMEDQEPMPRPVQPRRPEPVVAPAATVQTPKPQPPPPPPVSADDDFGAGLI